MKRTIAAILSVVLLLTALCGCELTTKQFTYKELTITAPRSMKDATDEQTANKADYVISNSTMAIFVLREAFSTFPDGYEDLTVEDYAELVLEANNMNDKLKKEGDLVTFTFRDTEDGVSYTYLAACYKSEEAFWLIQIACKTSQYDKMRDKMLDCLNSVTFND